ncbi:MAG: PHP domain-containing protein [Treponema sp.]|nr:PHP domain-containing protein [Treponema sp.]
MVDFHTHSNISDGDLSPDVLVERAAKQGLTALALTDHDTIKGLEIAANSAKSLENFKFIPGIEVNISWTGSKNVPGMGPGGEFHLLGLGINSPSPAFIAAIEELSRKRVARNMEILDRMHELSIDAAWEELLAIAGRDGISSDQRGYSIGRPHFAALLINRKIVKNTSQAFERYLGVGKPLYVPKEGLIFEEAVSLIRESGGIPVLAHPISLYVAWGRLPDLIKALKDKGLMGLEAWHPTAKNSSCRRLEALAQSLDLYITEGSDYHGAIRPDRKLGYSGKSRKISDAVLQAIPELMSDR